MTFSGQRKGRAESAPASPAGGLAGSLNVIFCPRVIWLRGTDSFSCLQAGRNAPLLSIQEIRKRPILRPLKIGF